MHRLAFFLLGSISALGCSGAGSGSSGCADGSEGCACYGNATCDDSLECNADSRCVEPGGGPSDDPVTSSGGSGSSGGGSDGSSPGGSSPGGSSPGGSPAEVCEVFPTTVTNDKVIAAGCYEVRTVPWLGEFVELTLSAGVTLVFSDGVWLEIGEQGTLRTLGTSSAPVVFTSRNQQPGDWGGVLVPYGSVELNHTIIEYGGASIPGTDRMACVPEVTGGLRLGQGESISILSSTFRNNRGAGATFSIECSDDIEFDGNVLSGNDLPLATSGSGIGFLGQNNDFVGNAADHVQILRDVVYLDTNWVDLGVPVFAAVGLTVSSSLILNAGVTVQFAPGTRLVVEGSLRTAGTDARPVVFESSETGESWNGVECDGGTADFAHTEFNDTTVTECE